MKKIALLLLAVSLLSFAVAESYIIDGRPLSNLSVEELYTLEDSIITALHDAFAAESSDNADGELVGIYVINPRTKKFHYPYCYSAIQIGDDRKFTTSTAAELVEAGYIPCGQCKPYSD